MILVKYTKKEYKIKALTEGTIQIGSTFFYQKIESEKIKDPNEGMGTVTLQNITKILTAEDMNRFFPHEEFMFKKNSEWIIDMQGKGGLVSSKKPFNCFIFFCSIMDNTKERDEIKKIFDYDSFYIIKDPTQFFADVLIVLKNYLIRYYREHPEQLDPSIDISKIIVKGRHQKVEYTEKPKNIDIYDSDLSTYNPKRITLENIK